MVKPALFASLLLGIAIIAAAGRLPPGIELSSTDALASGGLRDAPQSLWHVLRHHRPGHEDEGRLAKMRAYVTIRFTVPPSTARDFEDAWLKLEKDVQDVEKHIDVFDLKKSKLDNLFYWSYGEWERTEDFHTHLTSDHFQDFADFVDDQGIRWEVQMLYNVSPDVEDEQQGGHRKSHKGHKSELSNAALATLTDSSDEQQVSDLYSSLYRRRDMAHVLIQYYVPPGHGEGFIDAWTDTAEDTIKEKGNRIYSLRKYASDNTRFYVYGTWERMEDYLDHFESKHVGRLMDYTADKDIVWFVTPLIKIGHQHE